MIIREGEESDIPSIVELLKLSLGESLMPKSEAFWRWKHIDNPFGKSPVLLALDGNKLIGVRAFMRWEWKMGEHIYKAVRAVDTATHPDYQGKGIFKKLTLQLVDQCRKEGIDFIFNTPNKISKPGYLKMGWMSNGRLPVNIQPILFTGRGTDERTEKYPLVIPDLEFQKGNLKKMTTHVSVPFLKWRFMANPNIRYHALFNDKDDDLTIFRIKKTRFGNEFRICFQYDVKGEAISNNGVIQVAKEIGVRFITSTGLLGRTGFRFSVGPSVTTFPLSYNRNFLTFDNWSPSLGDMEVF